MTRGEDKKAGQVAGLFDSKACNRRAIYRSVRHRHGTKAGRVQVFARVLNSCEMRPFFCYFLPSSFLNAYTIYTRDVARACVRVCLHVGAFA